MHRRIFHDDAFGVGEALNETAFGVGLVARGQHYMTFGSVDKQISVDRLLAQRKLIKPQYFFTKKINITHEDLKKNILLQVIHNHIFIFFDKYKYTYIWIL